MRHAPRSIWLAVATAAWIGSTGITDARSGIGRHGTKLVRLGDINFGTVSDGAATTSGRFVVSVSGPTPRLLSFSTAGTQLSEVRTKPVNPVAIAPLSNGRLLTADAAGLRIARFTETGLDAGFSAGGVTPAIPGPEAQSSAITVQPDHSVLVGGTVGPEADRRFAITRIKPDGKRDDSFGVAGVRTTAFPDTVGRSRAQLVKVLTTADGSVYAIGTARNDLGRQVVAAARYDSSGNPDFEFGRNGIATYALGRRSTDSVGLSALVQHGADAKDDRLVVGGELGTGPPANLPPGGLSGSTGGLTARFALIRILSNGALDQTFGHNGRSVTSLGGSTGVRALSATKDGRLYAAGSVPSGIAVTRYSPDGILDRRHGAAGMSCARTEGFVTLASIDAAATGLLAAATAVNDGGNYLLLARPSPDRTSLSCFGLDFGRLRDRTAQKVFVRVTVRSPARFALDVRQTRPGHRVKYLGRVAFGRVAAGARRLRWDFRVRGRRVRLFDDYFALTPVLISNSGRVLAQAPALVTGPRLR